MNKERFRTVPLRRPSDYVPAPSLAGILFEDGETAHFKVRGLDANELFLAAQRRDENSPARAMMKQLQDSGKITDAIAAAMGTLFGDAKLTTAAATAHSTELIVMGTIDEQGRNWLDHEDVARLCEHYPAIYLALVKRIKELSGEDSQVLGESPGRSGKMIGSESPSTSAKPEDNSSFKPAPTSSRMDGLLMSS